MIFHDSVFDKPLTHGYQFWIQGSSNKPLVPVGKTSRQCVVISQWSIFEKMIAFGKVVDEG